MSNWQKVRLGEVCETNVNTLSAKDKYEFIYYLDTGNITNNVIDNVQKLIVGKDNLPSRAKRKVIANDIVFSTVRPNQRHFGIISNPLDKMVVSTGFTTISADANKVAPRFIYYYISQKDVIDGLQSIAEQSVSTYPSIKPSDIEALEFLLPPLAEQERIGGILGALDDKIECNNRINRNLEEQAQALFLCWFVDFDKKTWNEVDLGSVVQTTSGGTPSRSNEEYYKNGTINWVKSKELNSSFVINTEENITEDAVSKSSAKRLPMNSILIAMYGATVGEYGIISKEMTCNQAICALIPNDKYPYTFLLNYVKSNKENMINLAIGSAQQNISQQLIKSLQIGNCTDRIKQFHIILDPLYQQIKVNIEENQALAQLRDTLLPKLMNNEI